MRFFLFLREPRIGPLTPPVLNKQAERERLCNRDASGAASFQRHSAASPKAPFHPSLPHQLPSPGGSVAKPAEFNPRLSYPAIVEPDSSQILTLTGNANTHNTTNVLSLL